MRSVGNNRAGAAFVKPDSKLSKRRQCKLLDIPRSVVYCKSTSGSEENQRIMDLIDRFHLDDTAAGTRRMRKLHQRATGLHIGRKRVRRRMRKMGIEAIYPRK